MHEPAPLRPDGFRERGGEVTRIEAFVDAAFAFALTMLVISVGSVPDSMPKLIDALKGTPAFAASFALIATFWYSHMTWSRRYGLDDRNSILLSLVLVFLVMVFVYPLKVMAATFFGWVTDQYLPLGNYAQTVADLRAMFVIYALVYGSMIAVMGLLYLHAWRQRVQLELSLDERVATVRKIVSFGVSIAVAALSILLACGLPEHGPGWRMGLPGTAYSLLGLTGVVTSLVEKRMRSRCAADLAQ